LQKALCAPLIDCLAILLKPRANHQDAILLKPRSLIRIRDSWVCSRMSAPCLKVELDGTEVLPKKNAPVKWGEDVLDNEVRDSIRASHAEQDGDSDEDDDEDEQELAQIDSDDDFEEGEEAIPQDVMMKHITTLTQYGYADSHKLSRLSLQEWDDLARNVGIDDAHEHSVMLAIGIKKRKKIRKYKKRASTTKMPSNWKDPEEEDEDEEAFVVDKEEANEEEVTLEDELMRMALQRRASMDEGLSPRSTGSDGDGSFPSTGSGDIEVGSYSPMIQSQQQPEAGGHDQDPEDDDREGGGLSLAERIASRKKGSFGEVGGSVSGAGDGASTLAERIAARKAADDHTGDQDDSSSHLHHQITQRKAQDESRGRQDQSVKAVAASSSSVDLTAPGDGDSKQEILKKRIASRKDKTPTNKSSSSSSSAAKSAGHAPSSAPQAPPPGWSRQRQDSLNSNNSSPRPIRGCGSASSQAAARTKARSPRMLGMMGRSASGGNKASNPTPPRGRAPPSTQVPQPRKQQSPLKKQQSPLTQPPSKMTLAERREHEHEAKQRQLNDDNSGDDDDSLSLSSHTSGTEYEATLGDSAGGGGGARRSEMQGKTTRKRVPTPGRTGWAKKGGVTSGVRSASPFRASSNGRERGSTR